MSFFKKKDEEYILHTYPKGVQPTGKRRKKITRTVFMPVWKDKNIVHLSITTPIIMPKELAGKKIMIIAKTITQKRKEKEEKTRKKRKKPKSTITTTHSFIDEIIAIEKKEPSRYLK